MDPTLKDVIEVLRAFDFIKALQMVRKLDDGKQNRRLAP